MADAVRERGICSHYGHKKASHESAMPQPLWPQSWGPPPPLQQVPAQGRSRDSDAGTARKLTTVLSATVWTHRPEFTECRAWMLQPIGLMFCVDVPACANVDAISATHYRSMPGAACAMTKQPLTKWNEPMGNHSQCLGVAATLATRCKQHSCARAGAATTSAGCTQQVQRPQVLGAHQAHVRPCFLCTLLLP